MLARLPATLALAVLLPAGVAFAQSQPATTPPPATTTTTPAPATTPAPVTTPDANGGMFYTAKPGGGDWFGSTYVNHTVYGPKDEKLGKIIDLIMSSDGKVVAAVVGVGGFLGIGEKDVAVTFESLSTKTKNGSTYLTLNVTKDALKAAPKIAYAAKPM